VPSVTSTPRALKASFDGGNATAFPLLRETLEEINALDSKEVAGLRVRSRIQVAEEDEQSSRFFYKSIQENRRKSLITGVFSEDGSLCTDTEGIFETFSCFYKNLFAKEATDLSVQGDLLTKLNMFLDP